MFPKAACGGRVRPELWLVFRVKSQRDLDVRGMGGGDVKLAALLGAIAGAPAVLSVLPVAVFGGAVAALTLAAVRQGGGAITYGPFLAGGAMLAIL